MKIDAETVVTTLRNKQDCSINDEQVNDTIGNPLQAVSLPSLQDTQITQGLLPFLPNFFLSNVRSISNNVDDLGVVVQKNCIDFAGITETWLNSNIPDSSINIDDFNLIRKDRSGQRGGGVCAFVRSSIPFVPLPELCRPDHEILWVKLRPYRLPREFSCIVVGLVYHLPQADNNELYDHLITSLDTILASHPTAGVIVMGDFNQFNFRRLCRNTSLKQIVKKSTRGNATLDLIFTNMKSWYNDPETLPAIGYQTICQSCCIQLVITTALIPSPKSGSEKGSSQICWHLVDFFRVLTGIYFHSCLIVKKCVICFMTLFSWVWIFVSPRKLLNCIAETKHGLLLKSNSLSLTDKRLLL